MHVQPDETTSERELRDDELILYYYGESRRDDEIRRRLEASPEARRRYDELCRALAAVDGLPVPEPGPRYGERVWNRLQAELADERARPEWKGWWKNWWKRLCDGLAGALAPPRLRTAAAVAAIAVAAFAAGRFWPAGPAARLGDDAALVTEEGRERIVTGVVADHFERSQRLLLELANAPSGAAVDLGPERPNAALLLEANRLYRETSEREGRTDLAEVLDELERLLLDLVHGPAEIPADDAEYRSRIDDVLFKVQVLGWRLHQQEQTFPPPPAGDHA